MALALAPRAGSAAPVTVAAGGPPPTDRGAQVALAGPSPAPLAPERPDPAASRDEARAAARSTAVPASARRFERRVPESTRQLLVVSAPSWGSTHATVRSFVRTAGGWRGNGTWAGRLGTHGLVRAAHRHQDSGTTPAGTFAITESFGRRADPGTALPYRRVTSGDWWVQDRGSPYYNQRRLASQGGFLQRTSGYNSSEHLRAMGRQYDYVAVIDFNRPDPVVGRGSGIFLHVKNGRSTAGCVSIGHRAMRTVLARLDPAKHPMIVIGQRDWLRASP